MQQLSSLKESKMHSINDEYQRAKKELKAGEYEKSFTRMDKVLQFSDAPKDAILFWIWADLKKSKDALDKEKQKQLTAHFESISLENRKAYFFFVKGLFMKHIGKQADAMKLFNKALLISPKMIEARQERYSLKLDTKQNKPKRKKWFFKSTA